MRIAIIKVKGVQASYDGTRWVTPTLPAMADLLDRTTERVTSLRYLPDPVTDAAKLVAEAVGGEVLYTPDPSPAGDPETIY